MEEPEVKLLTDEQLETMWRVRRRRVRGSFDQAVGSVQMEAQGKAVWRYKEEVGKNG